MVLSISAALEPSAKNDKETISHICCFLLLLFVCRKKVATNRSNKITKLCQQSSVLKDKLKELESNLVMTETVTSPTQVKLKQVG